MADLDHGVGHRVVRLDVQLSQPVGLGRGDGVSLARLDHDHEALELHRRGDVSDVLGTEENIFADLAYSAYLSAYTLRAMV